MSITDLRPIDLSLAESKPALIAVSPTVSIQTALNKMLNNKITSLPVFSHNSTEVVSIVNLFDILLYIVGENDLNNIEKEKLKVNDPVERVLGLDTDRESYRIHKVDRKDKLIEVCKKNKKKTKDAFQILNINNNRLYAHLLLVNIELL
jgi:CBS domain containing-hemolysin-like protein